MASPIACKTSGLKTDDAAISAPTIATGTRLVGATLLGDGTNSCNVILYDNKAAASGTVLAKVILDAGLTQHDWFPPVPVACSNGIYADVTGTGAAYIVYYE